VQGHPARFEIRVNAVGRAEAFYNAVTGWQFGSLDAMAPESYRMIVNTPSGAWVAPSWLATPTVAALEP
jgi:predicted enzyme related to lactoylglutathione lyase